MDCLGFRINAGRFASAIAPRRKQFANRRRPAYGAAMVTEKDISMIRRFAFMLRTTGEVRLFQAASPIVAVAFNVS